MISTSQLFVEHTISGILASLWILSILFCINGINLELIKSLNDYWALIAILGTAISYPLGMFVDTIADKLLDIKKDSLQSNMKNDDSLSVIGLLRKVKDDNVTSYFTYNRFKERVCRSSMLNFVLIGLFGSCFVYCRGAELGFDASVMTTVSLLATFSILSVVAFLVWSKVVRTVDEKVFKISRSLNN